jgi:hypothetical protein
MPSNKLNHNRTLSNMFTELKYTNDERRWSRYGRNGENAGAKGFKAARRRYNRAVRKASKLQLSRYHVAEPTQQELNAQYYEWEDDRYMEDMDWTLSRDEKRFNDEVRGSMHLNEDRQWCDWNKAYDEGASYE